MSDHRNVVELAKFAKICEGKNTTIIDTFSVEGNIKFILLRNEKMRKFMVRLDRFFMNPIKGYNNRPLYLHPMKTQELVKENHVSLSKFFLIDVNDGNEVTYSLSPNAEIKNHVKNPDTGEVFAKEKTIRIVDLSNDNVDIVFEGADGEDVDPIKDIVPDDEKPVIDERFVPNVIQGNSLIYPVVTLQKYLRENVDETIESTSLKFKQISNDHRLEMWKNLMDLCEEFQKYLTHQRDTITNEVSSLESSIEKLRSLLSSKTADKSVVTQSMTKGEDSCNRALEIECEFIKKLTSQISSVM